MDRLIVSEKLESLRRCLTRIQQKTPPEQETLSQDPDVQDILVVNLTRAVQLCVDIGSHIVSESSASAPKTMSEVFEILENLGAITPPTCKALQQAVGFRNIAVHNYDSIDWEIVWTICNKSLADFGRFSSEIASYANMTE